ncbi:class III poly(R)-hydroxyalkanoic acid synthase subunit PhaC [Oscillochloris sp. ZM17-4]|nr:class III poly(R)-hydroxyalkanoic acid synthase subunit PhaC [Oscillochloris sp. ZM17-4]
MPDPILDPEVMTKRFLEELDRFTKSSDTFAKLATSRLDIKIGQTPKTLIWSLNKAKLYHFTPVLPPEQRHPVPLLLIFALINRPDIFDLRPGNSFVEYLLNQGYDVYMVDWGRPGQEDSHYTFDDYVLEYMPRIVRAMQRHMGKREDKEAGPFNRWLTTEYYNVDELVRQYGNMPGSMIDYGSKMLKPVENFISNYFKLWDNLDNPAVVESYMAMNKWVTDLVDFPGGAFRQWVVEFYRENRLMEGTLKLRGETVNLRNIRCNFLNVIADKDHIVPTCQSTSVMDKVGTRDKLLLHMRGGHIGMMVGSGANKRVWPQIDAWLAKRSN